MHSFSVFEIFVRRAKTELVELFHIAHGAAHIMISLYAHRQGRAPDRETVYKHIFVRPSQSCQPSTRRLAVDLKAAVGFRQIILISHADILYYNVGDHRNNCKTTFICLYLFVSHTIFNNFFHRSWMSDPRSVVNIAQRVDLQSRHSYPFSLLIISGRISLKQRNEQVDYRYMFYLLMTPFSWNTARQQHVSQV